MKRTLKHQIESSLRSISPSSLEASWVAYKAKAGSNFKVLNNEQLSVVADALSSTTTTTKMLLDFLQKQGISVPSGRIALRLFEESMKAVKR